MLALALSYPRAVVRGHSRVLALYYLRAVVRGHSGVLALYYLRAGVRGHSRVLALYYRGGGCVPSDLYAMRLTMVVSERECIVATVCSV